MERKIQAVMIVGVVALVVGGVIALSRPREEVKEDRVAMSPTEVIKKEYRYLTWNDGAGFKFGYPDGVKIDNHPEDKENYANLTLTSGKGGGRIDVLMTDNSYKSIEEWAGGEALDSEFGNKPAKKIISTGKTVVGLIDNEILLTITREFNGDPLLEEAWEKIGNSFEFVYPTPVIKGGGGGGGEEVLEEE